MAQLAREHVTPRGINEQFRSELEQAGSFEHVRVGLQRILERLGHYEPM